VNKSSDFINKTKIGKATHGPFSMQHNSGDLLTFSLHEARRRHYERKNVVLIDSAAFLRPTVGVGRSPHAVIP